MSDMEAITIYLVGVDEEDAKSNFPFDSIDSARSYARDMGAGAKIYSVGVLILFDTIEMEEEI